MPADRPATALDTVLRSVGTMVHGLSDIPATFAWTARASSAATENHADYMQYRYSRLMLPQHWCVYSNNPCITPVRAPAGASSRAPQMPPRRARPAAILFRPSRYEHYDVLGSVTTTMWTNTDYCYCIAAAVAGTSESRSTILSHGC